MVIDPSNFAYSLHLANDEIALRISHDRLEKIVAFSDRKTNQLQIYKAEGPAGHEAGQYRDCIDIAAKLAFGFNKAEYVPITIRNIEKHPVVVEFSNKKEIDSTFFGKGMSVRVKQSSDIRAVEAFKMAEDIISSELKILGMLSTEKEAKAGKAYHFLLCGADFSDPPVFLNLLADYYIPGLLGEVNDLSNIKVAELRGQIQTITGEE